MIRHDEQGKKWILETERTALALGVSAEGFLLVTWFGVRFPSLADYPAAVSEHWWASFSPEESQSAEVYPPWGGARYAEPCLKVRYPDGVGDARLEYRSFSVEGDRLVIAMRDPVYALCVDIVIDVHPEFDLFRQQALIRNEGLGTVRIDEALSGVVYARRGPDYRLTHLVGRWAGETQLERAPVAEGRTVLESRRGFTSHSANPFFALDPDGASGENHGDVYFGELAWSGNWKISIERDNFGLTRASAGINDFCFSVDLADGATFETPALLYGYTDRGFGQMSRNLHAWQRAHLASPEKSGRSRKILYNSWEATGFAVSEEGQKRLADIASSIGVELFVMDDGWFGKRNHDRAGLGDWTVNREKFPNGLSGLISHVRSLGMEFGLWVEPEMVNPDSDLYRAHPDWVYHVPGRPRMEQRNQLVLNLARPDVADFVFAFLDRLLSENDISFIKWDLNRNISEFGWLPELRDDLVVSHIRAVYGIVSRLRERHPGVVFQSCSGGGGRVDIGILEYFDQVWPSDNTDAFDRLFIQDGFSYAYGAQIMEAWVTGETNWLTGRRLPLSFRFHSSMQGTLGIGEDLMKWDDAERESARGFIALYKDIRPIVQGGNLYRLASPHPFSASVRDAIHARMYVSPDKARAVLFVFACNPHFAHPSHAVMPEGLDPMARYRVTSAGPNAAAFIVPAGTCGIPSDNGASVIDGNVAEPVVVTMSGAALMARGVKLALKGDYASAVLVFDRE